MRKVNFLFLLGFLLSLGVVDFSTAQWEFFNPEVRGTNIESGRFWSTDKYLLHPRPEGPKGHRTPLSLPEGRVLKLNQAEIISGIIKGDFLVNDDTTGGCNQEYPTIAMDHSGSFVICWQDYRNYDWDIYAKRFDRAGHPLGSDFIVNNRHARIYEGSSFPSIAMDNHGNFVVCWLDYRNTGPLENPDIYAQRFSSSGNRSGGNFKVNDDTGSNWQTPPSISMDADGDFVICWGDWRDQRWDIYAQRYSRFGHAVDRNFRVTDDSAKVWRQTSPSVAMDKGGDFVICWMDYRNGDVDIYAQRYENSGYKIGINFMVNDDVGTNSQSSPSVAAGAHGDFVICWVDRRDDGNKCDIYAQRYNSSGQPMGENFKVNEDAEPGEHWSPSIAMNTNGDFVFCWADSRNGDPDIYAQRYGCTGDPIGVNFKANDDAGTNDQYSPSVSMDSGGNCVICWQDIRNHEWDIYAQRYNSSVDSTGPNFRVNEMGTSFQFRPSIAKDADNNFVICWGDYRNSDGDIYAQRYNSWSEPIRANFKVNDDTEAHYQWSPSRVTMDADGDFVICWTDWRNGNQDIYAQRYNSSGNPLGANFKVNEDVGASWQESPSISMDVDGNFVICWADERNVWYNWDIYAQRYSSSGDTLGANFRVNYDVETSYQESPSISMDADGDFVISWESGDIYAQRYSSSGDTLGANFKVNEDVGGSWQYSPFVAMSENGNFIISWTDERNGTPDIYAQRYNWSGDTLGSNFKVNDDVGLSDQKDPSIAINTDGSFLICWEDDRNGDWDIYAQRYYSDGIPWGRNYLVNQRPDVPNPDQLNPSVVASNDRITFAWQDLRRSKGWDIYAKVVTWDWTPVDIDLPKNFALPQNYPNPFNATTVIRYSLLVDRYRSSAARSRPTAVEGSRSQSTSTIHVSLKIYNILGQEVRTLVNEEQPAGNYRVLWGGRDSSGKEVSSGVYFCRLKVTSSGLKVTKSRKMVMIR